MATSWQYNTSANMGSYGSVTVVPHTPITPSSGTSNSQYGAWFGTASPGSRPITGGGGGLQNRSPMRVLGNVPSASDKYSSMKTNTVSAMIGHPVPDPKEKFSSLANKFGAGRILTPITSQYDMIMQEEEEAKPSWKDSKTPIHSPEMGDSLNHVMSVDIKKIHPAENGHKRVTYKDDGLPLPQKDSYESSLDSRVGNILGPKLPGFERSQTLLSMAQQTPNLATESAAKSPFSIGQRSNTFTSDMSLNRYGQRDVVQKPLYPWRHEPHPPAQPPPTPTTMPSSSSASLTSTSSNSSLQRSGLDYVDSAGSQRTTASSETGSYLHPDTSQTHSSLSSHSSQSSAGANNMYWLYGSRGRPPPPSIRPSAYMYKMEAQGDSVRPSVPMTPERDTYHSHADLSPVVSPRGHSLHTTSANDLLRSSPRDDREPPSNITHEPKYNPSTLGRSAKKSILKKTSSYDTGFDFSYFGDSNSQFRMENSRSMSSINRGPPGTPVKLSSGSGKRVTFKLTPRTREISPREGQTRDYMSMFTNFRFDSSLTGSSEI